MTRARRILLALLAVFILLLLLPAGAFYWRARHALPEYDGGTRLAGLNQPVRVLRDERAVPHLYAENLEDLAFAQGYVHAQERLWQMDMTRRAARGELSEIVGTATLEMDKENRVLGLGAAADRAAELLDDETRRYLEAYARGVNAFIDQHPGSPLTAGLPVEFAMLRYRPEPWKPADTLAIGLNMYKLLTNLWRRELARAKVSARVGPELAADLYVARSDHDHPIAEPVKPPRRERPPRVIVAAACQHTLEEILAGTASPDTLEIGASNNWVVSGARTATGAPLLADDMHLPHTVPAIWFINHLKSPEVDVIGFSLPGVPWVIVGHNQRIGWGFTNLNGDVQDLFIERFDPEDPTRYMTPTGWQPVLKRGERIAVRGREDVVLEVLETRHGPIVHDDGETKIALQWMALDPANLSFPFLALNRAQNWEEFTRALRSYGGPAQNVVYADLNGNIGYHAAGRLPLRRSGRGEVPVPGDSSIYDWVGMVPFEALPHAFNPASGILATANNRVVPDNYPYHLTDQWIAPGRIQRIFERLSEERQFTPEDFLSIQGDIVSPPDRFLATQLVAAGNAVANMNPRAQEALALLRDFDGAMRADSAAPLLTDRTQDNLLEKLLRPHLGDDWRDYRWFMSSVFLENVLRERPARWLPREFGSYDELLLHVLELSATELASEKKVARLDQLRWGDSRRVLFAHPVGQQLPLLRRWFSIGGDPQSGGLHSPKQTHRTAGVSERMVVNFADFDASLFNITLGESGHVVSPHYKDQYPAWLEVRSFPMPFSDAAVERAARHRLRLQPR
ncbi:MAG TPA: penicillin acylase family protein [Candidatus Xenobia bacterium]|nr:penicillin acylase family protein [Candidatus Xenobia bacterium]